MLYAWKNWLSRI